MQSTEQSVGIIVGAFAPIPFNRINEDEELPIWAYYKSCLEHIVKMN